MLIKPLASPVNFATETIIFSARDIGNSPTTLLRKWLVMGRLTTGSKLTAFAPDGNAGSERATAVLGAAVDLSGGSDVIASVIESGQIAAANLVEGSTNYQGAATPLALMQLMQAGFIFTDNPLPWRGAPQRKSSNYTVTTAECGGLFEATAAANFTLPAITLANMGLYYDFVQTADANMAILGSTNIITLGNAGASSVTYSTGSQKIGARCRLTVVCIGSNTVKWLHEQLCTNTPTIA